MLTVQGRTRIRRGDRSLRSSPTIRFTTSRALTGAERPGDLLKSKKVDVMFIGSHRRTLDAYKLMYVTTGIDGSRR